LNYEEQAEKALNYLASTDEEHANAKALLGALQEQRKTIKAMVYLQHIERGKGQGVSEQEAYNSEEYREHLEKIQNAEADYQLLQNKRKRADLTIEMFRTYSANQRRGNV